MLKKYNILIIEDNAEMRENIGEILNLAGYDTVLAVDGLDGVQKARQFNPDLILCDIMMPNLDGFGVLKIKNQDEILRNIPLIFLTAKAEKEDFRKGMNLGAEDYLMKPFEDSDLLQVIESKLLKYSRLGSTIQNKRLSSLIRFDEFKKLEIVQELIQSVPSKEYGKKSKLWTYEESVHSIHWLEEGMIKETMDTVGFKTIILNFINNHNFVDAHYLFQPKYHSQCETIEPSLVKMLPKQKLEEIIIKENLLPSLLSFTSRQYYETAKRLSVNSFGNVREKIAYHLIILEKSFNHHMIQLSREDLAAFCGMAKETLIRTLSEFKEEKLIEIDSKGISIKNNKKLECIFE